MADNVEVNSGTGIPVSTDDCGGFHAQRVKLAYSADGVATHVPADGDGLLVNVSNSEIFVSVNNVSPIPISGAVTGPLTDAELRADPVPVEGEVTVGGSVAVTGTFWQATQPVSGTFWQATQPVSGTVTVTDGSGSLTVDGTVTANLAAGTNNIGDVDVLSLPSLVAGNANIGDVDVASIAAGTNHIGAVAARPEVFRITVQSAGLTTASTAYTAGDQMGNQFTIANAGRASGGSGYITGVQIVSAADIVGAIDVVFTDSSITLAADNAAYAISDADALNVIALVNCAGSYDIGANRLIQAFNIRIPYVCNGGTSIFAGLITRAGHTFFGAATDLQLIVYVERA